MNAIFLSQSRWPQDIKMFLSHKSISNWYSISYRTSPSGAHFCIDHNTCSMSLHELVIIMEDLEHHVFSTSLSFLSFQNRNHLKKLFFNLHHDHLIQDSYIHPFLLRSLLIQFHLPLALQLSLQIQSLWQFILQLHLMVHLSSLNELTAATKVLCTS